MVTSKPSTIAVLCTMEYDKFNMIKGNRTLDMNKIKKIHTDIEEGTNLLRYFPILVVSNNGKLDIIDGQHRFFVTKKIKAPVHYILAEDLTLYQIARLNSNTEKWKSSDFIHCYVELGNDDYKKLEQILSDYKGLSITTAICLLSKGNPVAGGNRMAMDDFHRGSFKAAHHTEAVDLLELAVAFEFKDNLSRHFLLALQKVQKAGLVTIDELTKKVNGNISMLEVQTTWKKYCSNLEEIMNKGKHVNRIVFH